VKVPLDFSTIAHLNVLIDDDAASFHAWICCPDQTDAAPSLTVAPLANIVQGDTAQAAPAASQLSIRTSSAGLIAARVDIATADLYAVVTLGFTWARRN
jgi:hypothetical protein